MRKKVLYRITIQQIARLKNYEKRFTKIAPMNKRRPWKTLDTIAAKPHEKQ
jgi:hypothetical protein